MNNSEIVDRLEKNKSTFIALFSSLHEQECLWREKRYSWSLLEVLCHLVDEEIEDFRTRVKHVLESPHEHPPSINPVG